MVWSVFLLLNACATTTTTQPLYYRVTVKQGESVAEIAARFDTTWQSILSENNLSSPHQIKAGMQLRVKAGPGGFVAGTPDMAADQKSDSGPTPRRRAGLLFQSDQSSDNGDQLQSGAYRTLKWPVRSRRVTSHFGRRRGRPHEGIDLAGRRGDPVYAAAAGTVEYAARNKSYGRTVVLRHQGYRTLYAHLNSIDVSEGDQVEVGETIGEVGETGHAHGPHLHFEVRDARNRPQNPMSYLIRPRAGYLTASSSH